MDLSELEILKIAEQLADSIWQEVKTWDSFEKQTIGEQLARSADSIGANIAEGFGRFHFGDKVKFFYYSRGSIYETKYWLNRCANRRLLNREKVESHLISLTTLAKQLNSLASKTKRQSASSARKAAKEDQGIYSIDQTAVLFSDEDLRSLEQLANS